MNDLKETPYKLSFSKPIRFTLGILILFALYYSGLVDFKEFDFKSIEFQWLIPAFLLICMQILIAAMRWRSLLAGIQINLDLLTLLKLTWIGQFYSTFAFGTVGSDLSKTALVFAKFKEKRKRISLTIVIDRILGLLCLLIIATISIMYAPESFTSKIDDNSLTIAVALSLLCVLVSSIVFFKREALSQRLPVFSKFREEFIRRRFLKYLKVGFVLAMISQLGMSLIFYIIMLSLGADVSLETFLNLLWLSPVYLLSTLLPLTPAGIGVGQAVLAYMFSISGIGTPEIGATVATIFQLLGILSNSLGIFAVLEKSSYHRHSFSESSEKENTI